MVVMVLPQSTPSWSLKVERGELQPNHDGHDLDAPQKRHARPPWWLCETGEWADETTVSARGRVQWRFRATLTATPWLTIRRVPPPRCPPAPPPTPSPAPRWRRGGRRCRCRRGAPCAAGAEKPPLQSAPRARGRGRRGRGRARARLCGLRATRNATAPTLHANTAPGKKRLRVERCGACMSGRVLVL